MRGKSEPTIGNFNENSCCGEVSMELEGKGMAGTSSKKLISGEMPSRQDDFPAAASFESGRSSIVVGTSLF
jgi:hypothetical protein